MSSVSVSSSDSSPSSSTANNNSSNSSSSISSINSLGELKSDLRHLYPAIEPFESGFIQVSPLHTIYYEVSGKSDGHPVIILHGGPGGGSAPFYRQFFDPEYYRIVQFDQRGSGKSTPTAELKENTTWDLVDDIESIRNKLKIDKWHTVFGGSWGSTLSLAYAQTHPDRVNSLILRGIFLLRHKEIDWFYQEGASYLFADEWERYLEPIPLSERHHLLSAYHRRLTGSDEKERERCAFAWSCWEMAVSRLYIDPEYIARARDDLKFALTFARIESHYFVNGGFFKEDGELLKNVHKIRHIPSIIVQGRYDVVCPLISAWDLKKEYGDNAQLKIVADAGHSAKEGGIISELVKATDQFKILPKHK